MKLPSFKRLYYTDFEQQYQKMIEQLSYTVNNGFESLFNALNRGIDLRNNLQVSVRDVTLTVDSSGTPVSASKFGIDNNNPIEGTQIIRAINNSNSTVFPTAGIFISYSQNGNTVTINNITGLPTNNSFTIRVIAYLT